MISRSTISAIVGGMALGAGIAVAVFANAQDESPRQVLIQQPSQPLVQPSPTQGGVPRPLPAEHQQLHVQALGPDTFVTVKDHGDAQTVSVFKLDAKGLNHLTHKAKFFY
jgi:hypothetical protein